MKLFHKHPVFLRHFRLFPPRLFRLHFIVSPPRIRPSSSRVDGVRRDHHLFIPAGQRRSEACVGLRFVVVPPPVPGVTKLSLVKQMSLEPDGSGKRRLVDWQILEPRVKVGKQVTQDHAEHVYAVSLNGRARYQYLCLYEAGTKQLTAQSGHSRSSFRASISTPLTISPFSQIFRDSSASRNHWVCGNDVIGGT
jgi:hypothetical protein